jgi:hypothetical protein
MNSSVDGLSLCRIRSKKAALEKLAVILEPINQAKCRPKTMMTFRGFIEKYRMLKMANQKGTTVHGYETNIRAHYLPEFGDIQLSEITVEAVQTLINQKAKEGKAVQTFFSSSMRTFSTRPRIQRPSL